MTKEESRQKVAELVNKYESLNEREIKAYNEANSKQAFIAPLFRALGWDMDDTREVALEEAASSGRVDFVFKLNDVAQFYVEAKPLKADLNNPDYIKQAITYAYNKGVSWAVLTNFTDLRVFNSQHYNAWIQLSHADYAPNFDRLWLLSKESFTAGQTSKQAKMEGALAVTVPIEERLFKQLRSWRQDLFNELYHYNDWLKSEQRDEVIEKLFNRLIFIRTAEDRKLEEHQLLSAVHLWQKGGHKKNELAIALREIFTYYNGYYNSELFKSHLLDSERLLIDEYIIADILNGLYDISGGMTGYDFSVIDADVLGRVYEQYLGYIAKAEIAKAKDAQAKMSLGIGTELDYKLVEKKQHRKEQGIYYTPKFVTDYIVKETVGRFIKENEAEGYNRILNMKILDPACGSGSFLIRAYDELLNYHAKARGKAAAELPQEDRMPILTGNIFGVDLDQQAVEIARLNLLLRGLAKRDLLPPLTDNIKRGNSLISGTDEELKGYFGKGWKDKEPFNWNGEFKDIMASGGFDVVIGNPPYVFTRGGNFDAKTKQYYYDNFTLTNRQINTYLLFIDRAFQLLKRGGVLGFIVPNTWLTIDTFTPLRQFLFRETANLQIINVFDKVFNEASVDICLLIFKKEKPNSVTLGEFIEGNLLIAGDFSPSQFDKNHIINIALTKNKGKTIILDILRDKSKPLSDFATVSTGLKAYQEGKGKPTQTEHIKNSRAFHSKNKDNDTYCKYLEGRDVNRYYLNWSGEYLSYGDWLAEPRKSVPFKGARILVRQIPSLPPLSINAVYTDQYFLNDINSMVVFDFKCHPLFILAILNSKITTFWFINTFDKFQRKTFPQFKVKELMTFPIPNASKAEQETIGKKAQIMLELNKRLAPIRKDYSNEREELVKEIENADKEIDSLVYKLYGLTEEEQKIVEAYPK